MAAEREEPPEGCHEYTDDHEVPEETKKYWLQRYDLFSKFDDGIWLTSQGCKIAEQVAKSAPKEKTIIIDAFAGLGGNAIAFARSGRWQQVFAIEKDTATLTCAKHNAAIYGVKSNIVWIQGDCFDVIKKRFASIGKKVVIFASPPWGGPGYSTNEVFDLSLMEPYNITALHRPFTKLASHVILYLPRSSDLQQLADLIGDDESITVTHYCIRRASKAICVFFGDFRT